MAIEIFRDDDDGYLTWLRTHYGGYVINAERALTPSAELKLHQAACETISGQPPGGATWTGPNIKVCSDSATVLRRWAREEVGGQLSRCGTCAP
jgi:hypothetical protein